MDKNAKKPAPKTAPKSPKKPVTPPPAPAPATPADEQPKTFNDAERGLVRGLMELMSVGVIRELKRLQRFLPDMAFRWHGWQFIAPETKPLQEALLAGLKLKVDEKMNLGRQVALMIVSGTEARKAFEASGEFDRMAKAVLDMDHGLMPANIPEIVYTDPEIAALFTAIWVDDIRTFEKSLANACEAIKHAMMEIEMSIPKGHASIQPLLHEQAAALVNQWYDTIANLQYAGNPEEIAIDDGSAAKAELAIMQELRKNGASIDAAVQLSEMIHVVRFRVGGEQGQRMARLIIDNVKDLEDKTVSLQELEYKTGMCETCSRKDSCEDYARLSQAAKPAEGTAPAVDVSHGMIVMEVPGNPQN